MTRLLGLVPLPNEVPNVVAILRGYEAVYPSCVVGEPRQLQVVDTAAGTTWNLNALPIMEES